MEWITKLRLLEALVILATILVIMALIVNDMNRDNPIHVSIVVVVVTLTIWLLSIMFPESIYVDFRTHIVKLIALTIVISPCFAAYYNVVVNDGEEPEWFIIPVFIFLGILALAYILIFRHSFCECIRQYDEKHKLNDNPKMIASHLNLGKQDVEEMGKSMENLVNQVSDLEKSVKSTVIKSDKDDEHHETKSYHEPEIDPVVSGASSTSGSDSYSVKNEIEPMPTSTSAEQMDDDSSAGSDVSADTAHFSNVSHDTIATTTTTNTTTSSNSG